MNKGSGDLNAGCGRSRDETVSAPVDGAYLENMTRHQRLKRMYTMALGLLLYVVPVQLALSLDPDFPDTGHSGQVPKAFGRFVPEREDDFAWENDKVAFRVYGPSTNGKGQVSGVDAWLKKVEWPVIDKWYAGFLEGISYHTDHGEGYDPYHVGDSRGVGGTAIWIDGTPWPAGNFQRYNVKKNGPERVQFELEYVWETPLGTVKEVKEISLMIGDRLYVVKSVFNLNGKPAELPVAIGLTTHDEAARVDWSLESGRISTWELIDEQGLGTGVLLPPGKVENIQHQVSDEKDRSHIWLISNSNKAGELSFRAGYGWEAAGEIMSEAAWIEYLESRISHQTGLSD